MKSDELQAIMDNLQKTLGEENSALISDDLGKLITMNTQVVNSINSMSDKIKKLEDTNEKLVIANGNLLQQVPVASEYDKHHSKETEEPEKKSFNFRDAFDDKGNFKR